MKNNLENNFIIEVAKYFMNFLETDFKKRSINYKKIWFILFTRYIY